jgi:hypothetical protein
MTSSLRYRLYGKPRHSIRRIGAGEIDLHKLAVRLDDELHGSSGVADTTSGYEIPVSPVGINGVMHSENSAADRDEPQNAFLGN